MTKTLSGCQVLMYNTPRPPCLFIFISLTNVFLMLLHVGKLKEPSRQFCQQFTEMCLISGVELSHECNLILLNYHSKMPKCLVFIHWIEGLLLTLSYFLLMREETSKKYAGSPLSPPTLLSIVLVCQLLNRILHFTLDHKHPRGSFSFQI